ncbi:MAG TPA: DUF1801 domain-containing protein [Candidatus Udaeobacter sp.]|jgi:uncharacterized protein YdhG (YjbR/CyaY superfamily)
MNLVKKKPGTIDEYLANVKPHQRKTLRRLRHTIQAAAPNLQECISYGLPAFRLNRHVLVFFGAWANHCAFYPGSAATLKKFRNELRNFQTSKGTIRFSPDRPLPVGLVKDLVKTRIAENIDRSNKARRKL